jgi:hypothetical protein
LGGEVKTLAIYGNPSTSHEWSADSKAILAIRSENGLSNIWRYPIDGSNLTKMTNFTKEKSLTSTLCPKANASSFLAELAKEMSSWFGANYHFLQSLFLINRTEFWESKLLR